MVQETDLYAPVKRFFEADGYEVKSEIQGCDVVASKPGAPVVIIELKLAFSLELVMQGIDRQKVSDDVYLAIPRPDTPTKRRNWRTRHRSVLKLCRRLGFGLILVNLGSSQAREIEVLLDPAPYQPRKSKHHQTRLKKEFLTRSGDPNTGGVSKRKIITAYRQDAIRCAKVLEEARELAVADIRAITGVAKAGAILQKNHYGWFERSARGVYRLTDHGIAALSTYGNVVADLMSDFPTKS